jgi:SAM-dependent methyltransferase
VPCGGETTLSPATADRTRGGSRWDGLSLVCPNCGAPLHAEVGDLFACSSGHTFPVVGGIPRFVAAESYAESFGYEWSRHRQTQVDSKSRRNDSRVTFSEKLGLGPDELGDRLVLDVGVGSGRFAEVAADHGARVVGVDLSRAVEAAAENLGDRALIAQADLFHLPFADGTFDVVYSIGVLHHTPDTAAAVRALASLVKPGGTLAIWVYQRAAWYRMADLYRRVTTGMSDRSLYRLCAVLARLYPLQRLPVVGAPLRFLLPVSAQADREWRVLDTFDWYAPTYQWKHTEAEVVGWFRDLGFESIEVLGPEISVRGRRPIEGEAASRTR